jgi:hypothetical protein
MDSTATLSLQGIMSGTAQPSGFRVVHDEHQPSRRREIVVRNPRRSTARTRSTALGLHVSSHRRWERAAAVCRSVAIARKSLHTALFYRAWASDNAIASVGVIRADWEPMRWNNSVVVPECCSELRQPSAGLRSSPDRGNPITTSDAGTRIIATRRMS